MQYCFGCMEPIDISSDKCSCGFSLNEYTSPPHHLLPGTLLQNRYLVGKAIGEGSFGITYIGMDTVLNMKVAVKELYIRQYVKRVENNTPLLTDYSGGKFQCCRERFIAEARIMAQLTSIPGIVDVQDFFEANGTAYLVMSYLDGWTLEYILKEKTKLPWQQTMNLFMPVLDTLSQIHKKDIIHCGICPENIMLTVGRTLYLLDFSGARQITSANDQNLSSALHSGYAAPEQYRKDTAQDAATDVYSVCASMYRCITGITPQISFARLKNDLVRPAHEIEITCPRDIGQILQKGMSPDLNSRYPDIAELQKAFSDVTGDSTRTSHKSEHKVIPASRKSLQINIRERSVQKLFHKKILLKDIRLTAYSGEMILILGGSGAGKTTFLNAVMGYEKANGEIIFNGQNLYREFNSLKSSIGYVPQQNLLREEDNVFNTVKNAAAMRLPGKTSDVQLNSLTEKILEQLGILSERNTVVRKLSGGQKKRLSIATELTADPTLFFLDEPDSGLDGIMARSLMETLRGIADDGKIVMVITHSPDRASDLFDKILVLAKSGSGIGQTAFYGTIEDAKSFFGTSSLENIVRRVNPTAVGGEGRADEYIERFAAMEGKLEI